MSWTDIFPVMDDDLVDDYLKEASEGEKIELDDYFEIDQVFNPRPDVAHVVAASLFWKHAWLRDGKMKTPTRRTLTKAYERSLDKRWKDPWKHYVEPLLDGAELLMETRPDVCFRVYLANDLRFLVNDLLEVGCEVQLMKHSSLSHNPGAMWRLLALEENGKLVTLTDSDRARDVIYDIERTESLNKIDLGFWRIPTFGEIHYDPNYRRWNDAAIGYRPVMLCQMGARVAMPTGLLMKALIWNTRRERISPLGMMPGCGELPVYGFVWPDYGFDEWFAITTLFPRMALEGILTFQPVGSNATLFPLDVEYVTWANSKSEIVHFGARAGCCGVDEKMNLFEVRRKNKGKVMVLISQITRLQRKFLHRLSGNG